MIKKLNVTECEVLIQKDKMKQFRTYIDIPFYPDLSTREQMIKRAESFSGYKIAKLNDYKHISKWYKIDPDDFCVVGIKTDKKMVGMISHTKRTYHVTYTVNNDDNHLTEITRDYTNKIRRRDLDKRFKKLLETEGRYDFIQVKNIEIEDSKYWITPEQALQIGIDVTDAVEAVR